MRRQALDIPLSQLLPSFGNGLFDYVRCDLLYAFGGRQRPAGRAVTGHLLTDASSKNSTGYPFSI
jgi:hypothetical protein